MRNEEWMQVSVLSFYCLGGALARKEGVRWGISPCIGPVSDDKKDAQTKHTQVTHSAEEAPHDFASGKAEGGGG